jgi:hypothetical protein
MKKIVMMTMAAMAFVMSMSSCSKDDDDNKVEAVATQVAGSYSGNEVVMVMGEESSNDTKIYVFAKASDTSVDLTIPEMGMGGHMSIPALPVKSIALTKSGNTITGKLDSFEGVVTNASGDEKNYTISNLALVFSDKTIAVTFSLKYGNMPMTMDTTFTGIK